MYENLEPQTTTLKKIQRNIYLIVVISLLTHTMSIIYSIMSFKQQSAGFISIIISSLVCFFLSSSHLTIYGISILGIMYLKMLQPYYSRNQLHYMVAISGLIIFPLWRIVKYMGRIFGSFPGRIHGSMVFGTTLIVLSKFFPLSIQNIQALFVGANSSTITHPWNVIVLTFKQFNFFTLLLTIISISIIYFLRKRLIKVPFIGIIVLVFVIINTQHFFKRYEDLCKMSDVDCKFYLVKLQHMIPPSFQKLILMIPSALVMTAVLIFQQFLYLQQFQRRGKRYFGQGDLGQTSSESKTLALANLISGCMGGLPICINLFGTYENFSYNIKSGQKGTKLVGLLQIPISYAFYSILRWFYELIPLFLLFVIVAAPTIYFLSNVFQIHNRQLKFIACLAALNLLTHPIIALVLAAFISIHDISELLKAVPSQILLQAVDMRGSRRSSTIKHIVQKKQSIKDTGISQFEKRVIEIDTDQPQQLQSQSYILYRFTGAVSYLNFFEHIQEINSIIDKYIIKQKLPLLLSFRYSQLIDQQSLQQLAVYMEKLHNQKEVRVIFTGLHKNVIKQMQKMKYFEHMLRKDERCMYRLDHAD